MIPIAPSIKLVLGTILIGLIASGQYLLKLEPNWAWLPALLSAGVFVEGFFTIPAGTAQKLDEAQTNVEKLTTKLGGMASSVFLILALGAIVQTQTSCVKAVPVVGPVASCVSSIIVDALKGDTVAQIVADVGPGCAADAEQVVTVLLGSPKTVGTPAFKEAVGIAGKKHKIGSTDCSYNCTPGATLQCFGCQQESQRQQMGSRTCGADNLWGPCSAGNFCQ